MSDSFGRSYSAIGAAQGMVRLEVITIVGTAAAITATANSQLVVPFACKIRSARAFIKTGGTAAGPSPLLQYSTAGTGAWTTIGTLTLGTNADNTLVAFSVTETALAAGDALRIAAPAGTLAASPVLHVTIGFTEEFTSA